MTVSKDDLHELVDRLPGDRAEDAYRFLARLLNDRDTDPDTDADRERGTGETWAGHELLEMAGTAEGPSDLSTHHDRHLADG